MLRQVSILIFLITSLYCQVEVVWYSGDPLQLNDNESFQLVRADSIVSIVYHQEGFHSSETKYLSFANNGPNNLPEFISSYYQVWLFDDSGEGETISWEDVLGAGTIGIQNWSDSFQIGYVIGQSTDQSPINHEFFSILQDPLCNQMGDTNEDGLINILDVLVLVNLILSYEPNFCADLSSNLLLDIIDVVMLVSHILETE